MQTLQQGQDFKGLLQKSCQLVQTEDTLPLRPFSARLVDWPCNQSMAWESNSFPWTFILWNVHTDSILAWSFLVKKTLDFTSFWLRQSCLTPNFCVNLHFYSFLLCTQMETSDRFGITVDPHYRRKLCLWPAFGKADLKNSSCLKHLVKCYVQLPTDTICGL